MARVQRAIRRPELPLVLLASMRGYEILRIIYRAFHLSVVTRLSSNIMSTAAWDVEEIAFASEI
jgi:hypothetical protein